MRIPAASFVLATLAVASLSPLSAAPRFEAEPINAEVRSARSSAAEGSQDGYANAAFRGRIVSASVFLEGGPLTPVVVGCRLRLNTGPNLAPLYPENDIPVSFYYATPTTPPDLCLLTPQSRVELLAIIFGVTIGPDYVEPGRPSFVGTWVTVKYLAPPPKPPKR